MQRAGPKFGALAPVFILLFCAIALAGWNPEERLTFDPSVSNTSYNNARCVACDSAGNIHVVWTDYRAGVAGVYHKYYDGVAWSNDSLISPDGILARLPSVAVGPNKVHVAWVDWRDGTDDIYYRALDGTGWGPEICLTISTAVARTPSVAVDDSGRVTVVWSDWSNDVYSRSLEAGTWGPVERLTAHPWLSSYPSVCADKDGNVFVVWEDSRYGYYEIVLRSFDGAAWSDEVSVTEPDSVESSHPSIAVDADDNVHVVWQDFRDGNAEIYHKSYDGLEWSVSERLTFDPSASLGPSVAADDSGNVFVVWYDSRNGVSEIYFKRFDGSIWGIDQRLTVGEEASDNPSIAACPGGDLNVVWQDRRHEYTEIYRRVFTAENLPAPGLFSMEPDEAPWGATVDITNLAGENFVSPAEVWLYAEGQPDIPASDVVVEYPAKITCTIDLGEADSGIRDVVIMNPDGRMADLVSSFTILELPAPDLISVNPDQDFAGESLDGVALAGSLFAPPVQVWLERPGSPAVPADSVSVPSSELITCHFDLPDSPSGYWDVVVENRDGKRDTLGSGFEVLELVPPEIASIEPAESEEGRVVEITDLAGDFFFRPVRVLLDMAGEDTVGAFDEVVVTRQQITCQLDLTGLATGQWDVIVENRDGQRDTLTAAFTVNPWHAPVIYTVDPWEGITGDIIHISNLAGQSFREPAVVKLQRLGESAITATNVTVESETLISCEFSLSGAVTGLWDVVVVNPNGFSDTLSGGFSVLPLGKPEIVSISRDWGNTDENVFIDSLTGNFLHSEVEVRLQMAGEADIAAASVDVISTHLAKCELRLEGAATGDWDLVIQNPDGQMDTLVAGFEVLPGIWGDEEIVSDDYREAAMSKPNANCVAVDGLGRVHVVWTEEDPTHNEVYYRMRDESGWAPVVRLTPGARASTTPTVAIDSNNNPHVVWSDSRISYFDWDLWHRTCDSTGWTEDELVVDPPSFDCLNPCLAIDRWDNLHVVYTWHDEIQYIRRDSTGWGEATTISDLAGDNSMPTIVVDERENLNVVWNYQNTLRYRANFGAGWGPDRQVTGPVTGITGLSMCAGPGDRLYLTWHQADGVYMMTHDGTNWGTPFRFDPGGYLADYTTVAADQRGNVFVLWSDKRDGNYEIYYRFHDGTAWSPETRVTYAAQKSIRPMAAVDYLGQLHVAWADQRTDSFDLYYRMRGEGLPAGIQDWADNDMGEIGAPAVKVLPNPVLGQGRIRFAIPSVSSVRVAVYDTRGRLVWARPARVLEAGSHEITWSPAEETGGALGPGVYFVELQVGYGRTVSKAVILR